MLQAATDSSQEFVSGMVRLKLFKGSVRTIGRQSDASFILRLMLLLKMMGAYDQMLRGSFN